MRINNSNGLTLIETVIALSLVVVLATAFAGAMLTGLKSEKTTNDLDRAVNFSASIYEYFNLKFEFILSSIELNSNSYNNSLENFKNEIDNGQFNNIYDLYTENLDYDLDNSKILIEKINEDLKLYKVELIIAWSSGNENNSYKLESIFGGSDE
ncbi:hypothetical protein C8C76_11223 [Halanaerobium saccharolyticum]|jgi:type II secretory pathway pseudopilin PulG|uniref:Prepilin-type N-terminal cleavage/methylation domain-containing protein n=1 Tax=Halanaerobium saccharolyticum TaxID=43595 RepID=A0A2T5RJY7_9FIRM|nr:hypothetical protein [Halanaerobium saccharolyticum]PTV99088.1 hypothetical protein C8C76_11223 [Halanaerobium saccharolyticum]